MKHVAYHLRVSPVAVGQMLSDDVDFIKFAHFLGGALMGFDQLLYCESEKLARY